MNEGWTEFFTGENQRLRESLRGSRDRVKELQALCREAADEFPYFCENYYEAGHIKPASECRHCKERVDLLERLREAGGEK